MGSHLCGAIASEKREGNTMSHTSPRPRRKDRLHLWSQVGATALRGQGHREILHCFQ